MDEKAALQRIRERLQDPGPVRLEHVGPRSRKQEREDRLTAALLRAEDAEKVVRDIWVLATEAAICPTCGRPKPMPRKANPSIKGCP